MAFTGEEGEFLLVHSLSIKLRKGVRSATESRIHGSIHLIKARCYRLPFLPHLQTFQGNRLLLIPTTYLKRKSQAYFQVDFDEFRGGVWCEIVFVRNLGWFGCDNSSHITKSLEDKHFNF